MMKKLKELYSSPTTTVLVVRFEGALMQSLYGGKGAAGATLVNADDEYDL